jgi:hypothetical protein
VTSLNLATLTGASSGLTTSTTAYSDGDQLGAIISMNVGATNIIITNAVLVDKSNIIGAVDCFIFDRSVTLASDNAAGPNVSDADALFGLGVINFPYPIAAGSNRISSIDSLAIGCVANASTTIYLALVTRSAHTFFGAATDLQVRITYTKDA